MCGRYAQIKKKAEYAEYMHARAVGEFDDRPRWNLSPTSTSLVAFPDRNDLMIDRLIWGIAGPAGAPVINARSETAEMKPTFSVAWRQGRAVVPVDGWFEWHSENGSAKQPYYFHRDEPILLAALRSGDRYVLLTAETHGSLRRVHHRRPVGLDRGGSLEWLNGGMRTAADLESGQIREEDFAAIPVSTKVNSTKYDDPSLIEPVTPLPVQQALF